MNGLIAPLLVMMMTGMVFCQQPQSNSFGSNSGNDTASGRLLGKYLLIMDQNLVRGLKTHGFLQAEIESGDRSTIDHIVFHSNDRNSENKSLVPEHITQTPSASGDGRLEFMFTDEHIRIMRTKGLQYNILTDEIGDYNEVVVYYKRPVATPIRSENANSIQPNERRSTLEPISQPSRRSTLDSGSLTDSQFGSASGSVNAGSQTFTPRVSSLDNTFEQSGNRDIRKELELNNQRFDRVARNERDRDLNLSGNNDYFRSVERNDVAPVTRNPGFPADRNDNSLDGFRNRQLQQDALARQKQDDLQAENEELKRRLSNERWIRDQTERKLSSANQTILAAEQEALRRNRERIATYDDDYRRPIELPSNRTPDRRDEDFDYMVAQQQKRDAYVGMSERNLSTPRPSTRPPELAINGPENNTSAGATTTRVPNVKDQQLLAEAERVKRNQQVLWFIMLCSVGLNFYLALIARSFYVRYEELADELRDTFSSSSM